MKKKNDIKILIVDDNQKNIQVLGTLLKNSHYNLIIAQNGTEAIERANKTIPDIILLDIQMPEMDGFEVCKKLKSNPQVKDVPIIFLTAQNESTDKVLGFSSGASDYVSKPYDPPELLARIETHLEIKFSREQIAQDMKLRASLKAHGILAHEVYNPLTSIVGNLDLILMMIEKKEIKEDKLILYLSRASEGCQDIFKKVEQLKELKNQDIDQIHDGLKFKKNP